MSVVFTFLRKPQAYFTGPQLTSFGFCCLWVTLLCRLHALYYGPADILHPYTFAEYTIGAVGVSLVSSILITLFGEMWYFVALAPLSTLLSVHDLYRGTIGYTFDLLLRTVAGVCVLTFTLTTVYCVSCVIYAPLGLIRDCTYGTLGFLWPRSSPPPTRPLKQMRHTKRVLRQPVVYDDEEEEAGAGYDGDNVQ